jgi:HEAT repeat protein
MREGTKEVATREEIIQLLQPLDDPHWFERLQAVGLETVLPTLIELVADQQTAEMVRGRAIIALGNLQDARATPVLLETLQHPNPVLRAWSAIAVGKMQEKSAAVRDSLVGRLADGDAYVRRSAAESIGTLGFAEAQGALEAMASNDESEANRRVASTAIEQIQANA